jgi:predicted nuclease with TOPRIM domain
LEQEEKSNVEDVRESGEAAITPEQFQQLQEQVNALKSKNERLMDENIQIKGKYKKARAERDEDELNQLKEGGKLPEYVDRLNNRIKALEGENKSLKTTSLSNQLRVEVTKYAGDAYDVEDVVRSLPKDVMRMDEESLSFSGVQDAVSMVRELKPHLFNTRPVTGMASGRPEKEVPREKTWEDLSGAEQDAALVDALKALGH